MYNNPIYTLVWVGQINLFFNFFNFLKKIPLSLSLSLFIPIFSGFLTLQKNIYNHHNIIFVFVIYIHSKFGSTLGIISWGECEVG